MAKNTPTVDWTKQMVEQEADRRCRPLRTAATLASVCMLGLGLGLLAQALGVIENVSEASVPTALTVILLGASCWVHRSTLKTTSRMTVTIEQTRALLKKAADTREQTAEPSR